MSTKQKIEFWERMNQRRVVMSGHGLYRIGDPFIPVPQGTTIHFYVNHGEFTSNTLGRAIEGITGTGNLPTPVESFASGDSVPDYRLGYPAGLTLNGSLVDTKYRLITVAEKGRWIPLSVLFNDSRCKNAEIHWAACREVIARSRGDMRFDKKNYEPDNTADTRNVILRPYTMRP